MFGAEGLLIAHRHLRQTARLRGPSPAPASSVRSKLPPHSSQPVLQNTQRHPSLRARRSAVFGVEGLLIAHRHLRQTARLRGPSPAPAFAVRPKLHPHPRTQRFKIHNVILPSGPVGRPCLAPKVFSSTHRHLRQTARLRGLPHAPALAVLSKGPPNLRTACFNTQYTRRHSPPILRRHAPAFSPWKISGLIFNLAW